MILLATSTRSGPVEAKDVFRAPDRISRFHYIFSSDCTKQDAVRYTSSDSHQIIKGWTAALLLTPMF